MSSTVHSCPTVQGEQTVALPREKVLAAQADPAPVVVGHSSPAGQGVQTMADARLNDPAAQAVWSTVLQECPDAQAVQVVEPATANSPAPHTTGVTAASAHLKPAGQVVQAAALGRLYSPELQLTCACPATQYEPAAQVTHLVPGEPETTVPPGQVEHSTTAPPELKVFAGQFTGLPDAVGHFCPAGHTAHLLCPPALVVPASQLLQAGSPRWL